MSAAVEQSAFASKQRFAIVAHKDNERVVFDAAGLQKLHDQSESMIQIADRREIPGVVDGDFREIGPVSRKFQLARIDAVVLQRELSMRLTKTKVKEERFFVGHFVQSSGNAIGDTQQIVTLGPRRSHEVIKPLVETLHAGFPQRPVNVLGFADTAVEMLMASVQSHPVTVCAKHVCKKANITAWWLRESSDAQADGRSTRKNRNP